MFEITRWIDAEARPDVQPTAILREASKAERIGVDHLDLVPGSAEGRGRLARGKAGPLRHQYSNGRLATRGHRFNSPTPSDTANAIIALGAGAALRHRRCLCRRA